MSASIEECMEVARRLRGIEAVQFDEGELVDCGEVEMELGLASDDGAWYRFEDVLRLADLIDPEPEQTCRWVSVEESLPESAGKYIVAYHPRYCDCVNEAVTLIGMDSFRGKTAWAKRKHQRVTHWMPKPELPKMDEIGNVCIRVNVGVEPAEEFDTIARALGYAKERTCRPTHDRGRWECDECGCVIEPGFYPQFRGNGVLHYCPNCGRKVVGE